MKSIFKVLLIISLMLLSGCGEVNDNKNQGSKIINENNTENSIPTNNTVTPINNTSSPNKLNDKGVTVIENQSFQTKLENWVSEFYFGLQN
ncbi:MAG TPA: hypothetical protein VN258_16105 [Mobilitalea sp.]|nr:hypothetical protein [Mobilitalea sp.]